MSHLPSTAFGGTPVFVPDVASLPPPVMAAEPVAMAAEVGPAGPTIRIRFPGATGPVERKVSWSKGKKLLYYLREQQLIGTRLRCRLLNGRGRRIRMAYVPVEDELISLVRVK